MNKQSIYEKEMRQDGVGVVMDKFLSRRQIFGASLPMISMLLTPFSRSAFPLKKAPSPIEELIPRFTLLIAKGRLMRHVFRTQTLEKKLIDGEKIDASELRLFDIEKFDGVGPLSSFLEVAHHKPIWARPDAIGLPAYLGTVYYWGFHTKEQTAELEKMMGKECIFLISSLNGLAANGPAKTFPFPLYSQVSDGHWREPLPLPITELGRVESIAKTAGFVEPKNIINANHKK